MYESKSILIFTTVQIHGHVKRRGTLTKLDRTVFVIFFPPSKYYENNNTDKLKFSVNKNKTLNLIGKSRARRNDARPFDLINRVINHAVALSKKNNDIEFPFLGDYARSPERWQYLFIDLSILTSSLHPQTKNVHCI